jgi:CheY-like chemotaxis protein
VDATPGAPRRRVLVCEDSREFRSVIADVLDHFGLDPVVARDGAEGIFLFERASPPFAAAIIDMVMPHVQGDALGRHIWSRTPDFPIVFSTGLLTRTEVRERFPDVDSARLQLLLKPYYVEDLITVLERLLGAPLPPAHEQPGPA